MSSALGTIDFGSEGGTEKMAENEEKQPTKDVCNVCHDDIDIYAVGKCDHFVCYKCSTRMRLLCEQMYCAICRTDLPDVLFMMKYRKYEDAAGQFKLCHKKENIFFENEKTRSEFLDLLSHKCKLCPLLQPMKTFRELELHMRRDHSLHYCDICVKDLKVFTAERKCYTREELARHRRLGDVDDKSFKGHPLCELCDQRYLDRDELARHCRKEHYYCHFCESDGLPLVFFGDYTILRDHFKEEHYLCEEGDCSQAQFTNAFRSEIDLKAHRTAEHSCRMNKAEIRQARTIDVDFHLVPRRGAYRGRGGRNRGRHRDYVQDKGAGARNDNVDGEENQDSKEHQRNHARQMREQYEMAQAVAQHLNQIHRQSGAIAMVDRDFLNPVSFEQQQREQCSSKRETFSQMPEDFPVLSSANDESNASCEESNKTGSSRKDTLAKKLALSSNLSVQDGDMENGDFPSLSASSQSKVSQNALCRGAWKTQPEGSDFPSLPSQRQSACSTMASGTHTHASVCSASVKPANTWVQSSQPPMKPKSAEHRSDNRNRVPSDEDFPSLHSIGNILLNTTPAAPGLSLTKLSSSSSSAGVGHGQPIKGKVPGKTQAVANFTVEDFPALGGKKDPSGLLDRQASSRPKEASYPDVGERKTSKPARHSGKQPAPMPDFMESSPSEDVPPKQEAQNTEQDGERWEVVKPQKGIRTSKEEKQGKEQPNLAAQQTKNKKKAKKGNKKKSSEENGSKTTDISNTDSEKSTQKALVNGKSSYPSAGKVDNSDKNSGSQQESDHSGNAPVDQSWSDAHKVPSNNEQRTASDLNEEMINDKTSKATGNSQNKMANSDMGTQRAEVGSFPSLSELSETTNILPLLDDFPSLPSRKQPTGAPPGFAKSQPGSGLPPGFIRPASKPPPGFSKPPINNIENIAPFIGGSISIPSYLEPTNFKARNEKLIGDIREKLSADEFSKFKSCSGEFRRGKMMAKEYYDRCCSIMGCEQFGKILPELISLLPDIDRQQQLLAVYLRDEAKADDIVHIKEKRRPTWKPQTTVLSACTVCRQVVLSSELDEHVGRHDTYADFPTLSSISSSLVRN